MHRVTNNGCREHPLTDMKRVIAFYIAIAFGLACANWYSECQFDREIGTTRSGFELSGLGILFLLAGLFHLWRRRRALLRSAGRERLGLSGAGFCSRAWPVLLLVPLLLQYRVTEQGVAEDGAAFVHHYGYGSEHRFLLFLLGAVLFTLFMDVVRLESRASTEVEEV